MTITSDCIKFKDGDDWSSLLDIIYPIGAIYLSYKNTSPAELLGGGWTQITGAFLRAANDTNTAGSDTVTLSTANLPSHTHGNGSYSASSAGAHAHMMVPRSDGRTAYMYRDSKVAPVVAGQRRFAADTSQTYTGMGWVYQSDIHMGAAQDDTQSAGTHSHSVSGTSGATGSGSSFSNMPKYQNVYAWRRTS